MLARIAALSSFTLVLASCPVSTFAPTLPANQTALSLVAGEATHYVALGRGVQNYSCTAGAWASVGAVAQLFDVGCIPAAQYPSLSATALSIPFNALVPDAVRRSLHRLARRLAPETGIANSVELVAALELFPWAKTKTCGYLGHHIFGPAKKTGSLASPANATKDVAWLELAVEEGTLAKTVYRLDTARGQPPSSCATANATLSVPYAALYWLRS